MSDPTMMQSSASPPPVKGVRLEECDDIKKLRATVEELHRILDDIDTLADMLKPEQNGYFKNVMSRVTKRHDFVQTDGYDLYIP